MSPSIAVITRATVDPRPVLEIFIYSGAVGIVITSIVVKLQEASSFSTMPGSGRMFGLRDPVCS